MTFPDRMIVFNARVLLPTVALIALLITGGFAAGLIGVLFTFVAAAAASFAFVLLERSSLQRSRLGDAIRVLVLFLFVSIPMFADETAYDGVNLPRLILGELGAIAVAVGVVTLAARSRSLALFRNGLGVPLSILVGGTALATLFARNVRLGLLGGSGTYDGFLFLVGAVILLVGCAVTISLRQMRAYLMGLVAASLPVMFLALLQFRDRFLGGDWLPSSSSLSGSTLGNQNHLGAFVAMLLPIVAALALTERRSGIRAGLLLMGASLALCLVLARSEGAFVAVAIALVVFVLAWLVRLPASLGNTGQWPARLVAVAAPIVLVAAMFALQPVMEEVSGNLLGPGRTSTAGQRFSLWSSAVEMARDRPLLGWGPDAYRLMFPTYQTSVFVQTFGANQLATGPHNMFFNQLAGTGVIGLVGLVAVIVWLYIRGAGALRQLKSIGNDEVPAEQLREVRLYVAALVASMTAYVVQASFNVQQVALASVFWFVAALLTALSLDLGVSTSPDPGRAMVSSPPNFKEKKKKRSSLARSRGSGLPSVRGELEEGSLSMTGFVIVSLVLAAGVIAAVVVLRPYQAAKVAYDARVAGESIDPHDPPPIEERFSLLDRSADLYREAFALNPWEYAYARGAGNAEYLYGVNETDLQTTVNRLRRAARWYGKAHDLRPRDPEMMEAYSRIFAKLYSRAGVPSIRAAAIEALRRAFHINPWDPDVSGRLVAILKDLGNEAEARRVLRRALEYRPDDGRLLELAEQLDVAVPTTSR